MDLLSEKDHGIGLARALRMPEHAQLAVCHLFLDDRVLRGEPCDDPVDAQVLVVSGNDFLCTASRGVEENEVLDNVEQVQRMQHALQQNGEQRRMLVGLRVVLIQPLPAIEMLQPG